MNRFHILYIYTVYRSFIRSETADASALIGLIIQATQESHALCNLTF